MNQQQNTSLLQGVYGTVKRGPLTPVCKQGTKCYGPAKHAMLAFLKHGPFLTPGKIFARVLTDAKGGYRIALPAGRYMLRATLGSGRITPRSVTVPKGRFVRVNAVIDTGIR